MDFFGRPKKLRLSGEQHQKLQLALIDAFPTSASLEQMLLHELYFERLKNRLPYKGKKKYDK